MKRQAKNSDSLAKAFGDALVKLYCRAYEDDFPRRVHSAFGTLFPSVCISYDEVDPQGGVLLNALDKSLPVSRKDLGELWQKWAADHPGIVYLRSGGTKTVFQISDFLTERQFLETAFFNEFWKGIGIRHQLSAIVPTVDRFVSISINRDTAFSSMEVRLMGLMQGHFAQAYHITKSLEPLHRSFEIIRLIESKNQQSASGNIEIIDGAWKGNVITGEIWRS